ncbi:MAG: alpha-galactosidase [Bacteroidales bacterium]|nr:alpha-galactosidase [Bacteroidales bacterium]
MKTLLLVLIASFSSALWSQEFVSVSENSLALNNGELVREIRLGNGAISSTGLRMAGEDRNYIMDSREFSFLANSQQVDGSTGWDLVDTELISDERMGQGVRVVLGGTAEWQGLFVEINYLLYPDLPLVRKWIKLVNATPHDLKIEAVNVEELQTSLSHVRTVVHHNYARMKHLGNFTGNWDDPVVVLHHVSDRLGMAVGNEAPGILKRTAYHTVYNNLEAGLTHPGQDFPFRKWLAPGESWETPKTFICLYRDTDDGFAVVDGVVNDFVRRHMYPQIIRNEHKPVFVYNTWNPFRTFVSDSLVREVALAAAECGIKEFIIDDGWQVNEGSETSAEAWGKNYGDWKVDEEKFPGGLKPTFDYINSLGLKPGLWMSVGSATKDAAVYKEHPEWFVRNSDGEHGNIHAYGNEFSTSCFGTDWVDYIKEVLVRMSNQYGLAYTKLDFAVAASAYVNDPHISGCYATDHPFHRDHQESFIVIYERVLELFDRLHRECPGLFIDCTFETAGKLQLMDYAIAMHADGNWLSNFEEPYPTGPLRIRQMAWWRSPAVPASSLVIGNTPMDDPGFEFALKSLIGTLPIVLGDPRKIEPEQRVRYREWSEWMQEMQDKYNYMSYRRDLPGFGEPREGHWDGWMRINNDTRAGGIIGVFRQGACEEQRQVVVKGLEDEASYVVKLAPEGTRVHTGTGRQLMEQGFKVYIPESIDGMVYEIERDGDQ